MARRTNWWLQGWEYGSRLNGHGGKYGQLVYKGEYYTFGLEEKPLRRLKLACLLMTAALIADYVLYSLCAQSGAARIWTGASILLIIPLMYLAIGTGCLLPVKARLTYRDYRGSVVRIRWSAAAAAALSFLSVLGEVTHVLGLRAAGGAVPAGDRWWLAGTAFFFADALALVLLERRYPARLIPPDLK